MTDTGNDSGARLIRSLSMNVYDNSLVSDSIGALICISGEFLGSIFRINANKKIYFGRDYTTVDFCFDDDSISRQHCWIEYDAVNRRYKLYDTSLNGVFLNGSIRVKKDRIVYLKKGDEIRLGQTKNVFKMG